MTATVTCLICGANGSNRYTCVHRDIVRLGKMTMAELNRAVDRMEHLGICEYPQNEKNLEVYQDLSKEAKLEICVMIALIRFGCKKIARGQLIGAVSGLELVMEMTKKGFL